MGCYHAPWNDFSPLATAPLAGITIDNLQACVDDYSKGKRPRQNKKSLASLLYKHAIPRHPATLHLEQYIIVGSGAESNKVGLPLKDVEQLRAAVDNIPYAGCIVAQYYLGVRPSELLSLKIKNYGRQGQRFIGGAKTTAGIHLPH